MAEDRTKDELLQRARNICAAREYCIHDISSRLEQWGEREEETISAIIGTLISEGFLSEERYCRAFVADHYRHHQWGRVKIAAALRQKKIPETLISSALEIIDEDEYLQRIRALLETYRRSVKARNRYDLKGKMLRHALGKGYESHLVYEMISSLFVDE